MTEEGQREFFETYLERRILDLSQPIIQPRTKGKRKAKGKQIKVTSEQLQLLQQLGLA